MKKCIIVILSVLMISACSRYASNGESLYLRSHNGPRLVVPPPLTSDNLSHFYDLPNQVQNPKVSTVPPVVD